MSGVCSERSAVIQTLLAPNLRLHSSIVEVVFGAYDQRHRFNAVLDTETDQVLIINNDRNKPDIAANDDGKKDPQKSWRGTFELILDPWAARFCDAKVYGPIFETVMQGARDMSLDYELVKTYTLKHLSVPRDPALFYEDKLLTHDRISVTEEDMPSDAEMERRSIRVLEDTTITLYDPEESNRLADEIAYRNRDELLDVA